MFRPFKNCSILDLRRLKSSPKIIADSFVRPLKTWWLYTYIKGKTTDVIPLELISGSSVMMFVPVVDFNAPMAYGQPHRARQCFMLPLLQMIQVRVVWKWWEVIARCFTDKLGFGLGSRETSIGTMQVGGGLGDLWFCIGRYHLEITMFAVSKLVKGLPFETSKLQKWPARNVGGWAITRTHQTFYPLCRIIRKIVNYTWSQ
jgi:hypothetical protein